MRKTNVHKKGATNQTNQHNAPTNKLTNIHPKKLNQPNKQTNKQTNNHKHPKAVSELVATAAATTVAREVAKGVLYFNAWWRGDLAVAVAAKSDTALHPD